MKRTYICIAEQDKCIFLVNTYGSENGVLTKKIINKMIVDQRAIERKIDATIREYVFTNGKKRRSYSQKYIQLTSKVKR